MNDIFKPLTQTLEELKIDYNAEMLLKFEKYMEHILEWNEKVNLTAIKDEQEFVIKHFVDSVMCAGLIAQDENRKIIDIGTGAGFPGIPLAIVFPNKNFTLMDSTNKKINIIREIAEEIGLANVSFIHGRAEDLGSDKNYREKFDVCVSRAVAGMAVLCEYCLPFVKVGGCFAAYKGKDIEKELADAAKAISILGGIIDQVQPFLANNLEIGHKIIYIKKIIRTPEKYPRKAGKALKEPI